MSVCLEGNVFIDGGQAQNITITTSTIGNSNISKSSIDMLSNTGVLQNITNVADPINAQDSATKKYVDDLDIVISNITLTNTNTTTISNYAKGSYVITISNLVLNGPSGIFHVTKSESSQQAHIARTVASPGYGTSIFLNITWPPNSGILLNKTGSNYNGTYRVKVM
jgi:hypothetical protein